jgi:hypothetical protein
MHNKSFDLGSIHNFRDWRCHLYSSCSSMMQQYMIVLSYLGSQHTKYHAAQWTCWLFTSFYLESCIWPDVISQWSQQRNSKCAQFCENLGTSATETLAMIKQAFGKVPTQWDRKKGETGEEQSDEHTHYFLIYQGDTVRMAHSCVSNREAKWSSKMSAHLYQSVKEKSSHLHQQVCEWSKTRYKMELAANHCFAFVTHYFNPRLFALCSKMCCDTHSFQKTSWDGPNPMRSQTLDRFQLRPYLDAQLLLHMPSQ